MGLINGQWVSHGGAGPNPEFERQALYVRGSVGEDHKRSIAAWLVSIGSDGWDAQHLLQRAREL